LPQSRHRKVVKARKKPKGAFPASISSPSNKNRSLRLVAMIIVAALAVSLVAYVITHRQAPEGLTDAAVTTPSGLKYTDLVAGTGPSPQIGQTVTVHYTGMLTSGKKFDSSYDHGAPVDFTLNEGSVIKGWVQGLATMKEGGKRKLVVPPSLGYGPQGRPPKIPGNATLVFEVELLKVK
jgi:peptidylprolyl isomerase